MTRKEQRFVFVNVVGVFLIELIFLGLIKAPKALIMRPNKLSYLCKKKHLESLTFSLQPLTILKADDKSSKCPSRGLEKIKTSLRYTVKMGVVS